jgi:hypothetical protein
LDGLSGIRADFSQILTRFSQVLASASPVLVRLTRVLAGFPQVLAGFSRVLAGLPRILAGFPQVMGGLFPARDFLQRSGLDRKPPRSCGINGLRILDERHPCPQGLDFSEANTQFHAALRSERRGQHNDYTIALRERAESKFI